MNGVRTAARLLVRAVVVTGLGALWGGALPAHGEQALAPRAAVVKPTTTVVDAARFRTDVITVKFNDGLTIRLRDGRLTDMGTRALDSAPAVLASSAAGAWQRSHELPEAQLDALRAAAEGNLGRAVADLNLQYYLYLPPGAEAGATIDALNALECVELALPVPLPVEAPVPPNYQSNQGYLNAATAGVDAVCMWQIAGGMGDNAAIADLEYSWNLSHQDFPIVTLLGATPNDPYANDNHGTAVLGELGALANGWGVTGISYNSQLYVVATNTGSGSGVWDVGAAITTALGTLTAGDVILIEQQYAGPNWDGVTQYGLIPVEWYQPWYNAIVTAVGNGVIVVEAAGNGSQDLDAAIYSTGNGGHWPFLPQNDSGAFIVGAGASPSGSDVDRSRLYYSNYGQTVDFQGWGENVYTTGYGTLYSAEGKNLWYTATFAGTSSASPIVAGACAVLESAHIALAGGPLSPIQAKGFLQSTGSPQQSGTYPSTQNIGPRPDASAALCAVLGVVDSDANLVPDVCEQLSGIEACCLPSGGCADTTPANCSGNGGIPQGAGTACATTQCATTEACCFPGPTPSCTDTSAFNCQIGGGIPQGPGTSCATTACPIMVSKFIQSPTTYRDNVPSNIDFTTMVPADVVADDFQSDGRPITGVRWWGTYFDARYTPVIFGGQPSPTQIDGWLISFHEPQFVTPGAPPAPPLGLYFAPASAVAVVPLLVTTCDGLPVFQYIVELPRCCLLQAFPDSRSGLTPAQPGAFAEEYCFVYDLDIQAVVGLTYQTGAGGWCVPMASPNFGPGPGLHFWGWYTSSNEKCQQSAQWTLVMTDGFANWNYGPWSPAPTVCAPAPQNMAFQLLTNVTTTPPPCTRACCFPDGSCSDLLPSACASGGGTVQSVGSSCATTICPGQQEACCLPGGACQMVPLGTCVAQGGTVSAAGMCMGDYDGNGIDEACELHEYLFEFSLDIGSDTELSDPFADGDEAFDPGDVYWWHGAPVVPPGRDGFKDDAAIFGMDPHPAPPDAALATRVPVGTGGPENYTQYFDLDGHDQLDIDLHELEWIPPQDPLLDPIAAFESACIHPAQYLMVSFDDDMGPGWPASDVPVTMPSPAGVVAYGSTPGQDEIVGVTLTLPGGPPPYPIQVIYPLADEIGVHLSLQPNPDGPMEDDDDVDSLDVVPGFEECPYWYFTVDHEASRGLDPGGIYEVTPTGRVQIIDEIHLGIPEDTDVDAFEFVWLEYPGRPGLYLAVLFSVDDDDPLTPGDESGGLPPNAIFASYLTGFFLPAVDGLPDDVDALTVWRDSLQPVAWCMGDMNCSGGAPTFDDIKYFSAAVGSESGWWAYYRSRLGVDPVCPWLAGDYTYPHNGVDFGDIKPFAASIGQPCQAFVP